MLKKVAPHHVATALANMVFPVPGDPTIKTPFEAIPLNPFEEIGHPHWKKNGLFQQLSFCQIGYVGPLGSF